MIDWLIRWFIDCFIDWFIDLDPFVFFRLLKEAIDRMQSLRYPGSSAASAQVESTSNGVNAAEAASDRYINVSKTPR